MVSTGITVSEETLEEFDDVIWELQASRELPRDASRSGVIAMLMEEWIDQQYQKYDWLEDEIARNESEEGSETDA